MLHLKRYRCLILLLTFLFILTGCTRPVNNNHYLDSYIPVNQTEKNNDNSSLRIGIVCEKINDDFYYSQNHQIHSICELIFDSLFKKTNAGEYSECLVKSFSVSEADNGTVQWSFTIRNDVYFNETYKKLTAKDCVDTIQFILGNECYYSDSLRSVLSCVQTAPYSFEIMTESGCDNLMNSLIFPIVSSESVNSEHSILKTEGSGSYIVLKEKSTEDSILLQRNNKWWKTPPKFQNLSITVYDSNKELHSDFQDRKIDFAISDSRFEGFTFVADDESLLLIPGSVTKCLVINPHAERFSDPGLREAIFKAINRDQIARLIVPMRTIEINRLQGTNLPTEKTTFVYDYDPQTSKKYVEEYKSSNPDEYNLDYPVSIIVESLADDKKELNIALFIKDDLEKIGIKAEIKILDDAQFQTALRNRDFELAIYQYQLHDFASLNLYEEINSVVPVLDDILDNNTFQRSFLYATTDDIEKIETEIMSRYLILPLFQESDYCFCRGITVDIGSVGNDHVFSNIENW